MNQILLVEDEQGLRSNIKEMLTLSGYHVTDAGDGVEALQLLNELEPDLIISDLMMPNMDGYQFLEQVRSRPEMLDVPFVILSALSEKSNIRKGMLYGAEDYLTKPFEFQDLLSSVQTMLNKRLQVKKLISSKVDALTAIERNASIHELKTPLFAIDASLKLLYDDLTDKNLKPEDVRELLDIAVKSSKRLSFTIDKMERFQRLPQIHFTPSQKHANIDREYIQTKYDQLLDNFDFPQNDITLSINQNAPFITDEAFVYTPFIVSELLLNALKYTQKPGEIQVAINSNSLIVSNSCSSYLEKGDFEIAAFKQYGRGGAEVQGLGLGLYLCTQYISLIHNSLTVNLDTPNHFTVLWNWSK